MSAGLLLAAAYGSLDLFRRCRRRSHGRASKGWRRAIHKPQMALGLTFRQAKREIEARQAFEKAAAALPQISLWPSYNQLVELDLLEKHFDAARQRIRRQFQKTPDSPVAHFFEGKDSE